jgi:predicted anti-sigma-YlaC factor YlaD
MKCGEVKDWLAAYLDGEVTPERHQLIDAHLAGCEGCRKEMRAMASAQELLRRTLLDKAAGVEPSPQAWERLSRQITPSGSAGYILTSLFRHPVWRIALPLALTVIVVGSLWGVGMIARLRSNDSPPLVVTVLTTPPPVEYTIPPQRFVLTEIRGMPNLPQNANCQLPYTIQ